MSDPQHYFIQPLDADNEKGMKSVKGDRATKVTFINNRGSTVQLWWLDYEGKRVSYGTVNGKGGVKEMDTYITHPWVVVDESSGKPLNIYHPANRPGYVVLV